MGQENCVSESLHWRKKNVEQRSTHNKKIVKNLTGIQKLKLQLARINNQNCNLKKINDGTQKIENKNLL